MKGVDSLIVIAAIAIFMAGVVVGMVLMALAAAAKRNNERIERAEKHTTMRGVYLQENQITH